MNSSISLNDLSKTEQQKLQPLITDIVQARANADVVASRERCQSLGQFIKEAWKVLEPGNPYIHGWHIDKICDHLEAITHGKINRLIINVPPGTMKSLITSVFWPAWEWGPGGMPWLRYLTTSYSDKYVKRDSRKMRDLVSSEWYQARWPSVQLVRTGETSFENTMRGNREGVAFASMTGGRGDRVIIDDPHSTESAESELDRQTAIRIFLESVPTRLNRPDSSAIVVIMQRLHVEDVTGVALERGLGYEHLMLPMEFEVARKCYTSIGFEDPRTVEGELLFPERFPAKVVERDKIPMGSYAVAGQFQQRPTLREGGLFKAEWFNRVRAAEPGTRWVRYWDLAATAEQLSTNAAYTVGLLLGRQPASGRYIIGHVKRFRSEGHGVRKAMLQTAQDDGRDVMIGYPQDPGQAGKVQAQDLSKMLSHYLVHFEPETGDKVTRAEMPAAQAEAGNMDILDDGTEDTKNWIKAFLDEASDFPGGRFKDQVDALSGAFAMLRNKSMFNTSEFQIRMPTPWEKKRLPDKDRTEVTSIRLSPVWPRVCAIELTRARVGVVWAVVTGGEPNDPAKNSITVYDSMTTARSNVGMLTEALRARGEWIPILIDEVGVDGRPVKQTEQLVDALHNAHFPHAMMVQQKYDLETGVTAMIERMDQSRLKVFDVNAEWFHQFRRFARDEKNEIILTNETELIRATAFLGLFTGFGITENQAKSDAEGFDPVEYDRAQNDNLAGY